MGRLPEQPASDDSARKTAKALNFILPQWRDLDPRGLADTAHGLITKFTKITKFTGQDKKVSFLVVFVVFVIFVCMTWPVSITPGSPRVARVVSLGDRA
jgi:hypothetical protein